MFNVILDMFKFWEDKDKSLPDQLTGISVPSKDDGAIEIEVTEHESKYNGVYNRAINIDASVNNTRELVNTYRGLLSNYEVDNAIQEIVSDAIVYEPGHQAVALDLSETKFSEKIKTRLHEELDEVLLLLDFQRNGQDHFKRWYIDSRLYFHKIVDPKNPKEGIKELRHLDPRNVQYIREVITEMENGVKVVKGSKDFFTYDTGLNGYSFLGSFYSPNARIKIPVQAVAYSHSGLVGCNDSGIIGYLHRVIKPSNQLKLLEDSMVIYRLTRAPDRRVFYVDTGNMPSKKAQAYMQSIMDSMKNRIVYDAATGRITNQRHLMSLTEDYWLQRRDGKAVTEVDTLPGMQGMNEMEDVKYFRKALYMALRVPLTRIPDESNAPGMFDSGTSITRDELRFSKFIVELQHKFEQIILDPLKTNLILKGIITEKEWDQEINNIKLVFHKDSYFAEIKDVEIAERRINILSQAQPYIGKYISHKSAMREFLQFSEERIEEERKIIDEEEKSGKYKSPQEDF